MLSLLIQFMPSSLNKSFVNPFILIHYLHARVPGITWGAVGIIKIYYLDRGVDIMIVDF